MTALPPFTHHQILALVAPFTRSGHHVDLAASERLERRLRFKSATLEEIPGKLPACRETLVLENPTPQHYRLVRELVCPDGLSACCEIEGADPAALLGALQNLPVERGFLQGPGYRIALQLRLSPPAATAVGGQAGPPELLAASAHAGGLTLHLRMSRVSRVPADVLIEGSERDGPALPEDLLAVLGWQWGNRMQRVVDGWRTTLLVRGRAEMRGARAIQCFETAVAHVARTLEEPPSAFHHRCAAARWGVVARRSLPLVFSLVLMTLALMLPRLHIAADSSLRMLIFNAPPLLLVLVFSLRELPRIEIPPLPRAAQSLSWYPRPAGT